MFSQNAIFASPVPTEECNKTVTKVRRRRITMTVIKVRRRITMTVIAFQAKMKNIDPH